MNSETVFLELMQMARSHMLQAGSNIVYIRDVLGHSDLNTTERYARADTAMKREALSKAEIKMPDPVIDMEKSPLAFAEHSIEENMTSWLKSLLKE